jgi:hypothetical protein
MRVQYVRLVRMCEHMCMHFILILSKHGAGPRSDSAFRDSCMVCLRGVGSANIRLAWIDQLWGEAVHA